MEAQKETADIGYKMNTYAWNILAGVIKFHKMVWDLGQDAWGREQVADSFQGGICVDRNVEKDVPKNRDDVANMKTNIDFTWYLWQRGWRAVD